MSGHTPFGLTIKGPGRSIPSFSDGGDYALLDHDGAIIAEAFHHVSYATSDDEGTRPAEANARRLAAGWNACIGITTDELEEIARTGGMLGPREDVERIAAQRDSLLDALEKLIEAVEDNKRDSLLELIVAHDAIAKARGAA